MNEKNENATQPPSIFFLVSDEVPMTNQKFFFEIDAQHAAETIARHHRGAAICIAKIIAAVVEPLPNLEWTDGRTAGDGHGDRILGLASQVSSVSSYASRQYPDKSPNPLGREVG